MQVEKMQTCKVSIRTQDLIDLLLASGHEVDRPDTDALDGYSGCQVVTSDIARRIDAQKGNVSWTLHADGNGVVVEWKCHANM